MTNRFTVAPVPALSAFLAVALLAGCGGSKEPAAPAGTSTPLVGEAAPAAGAPGGVPAPAAGAKPATAQANPLPKGVDPSKPVATVNGVPITADNAYSVYAVNKAMIEQRRPPLNDDEQQRLRAQTLENLIAEELLFQGANAAGVKVGPADIDARIKDLKKDAGSEENYKKMVADSGMNDADVRARIERQLKTEAFEKSIAGSKGVSEDLAKKFYEQNKEMFKVPEQAHVLFILINATDKDPDSVRADAKARAEEVQKKAAAGANFSALAKQYSQDATAAKGGDIGFFPKGIMFPKFEEMAFTLPPGSVSPVFETPKGFNIIKVLARKPAAIRPFEEVKNSLMVDMGRAVAKKLVNDKLTELASKAKIDVLDPAFKMPPPTPAELKAAGVKVPAAPSGSGPKKP